MNKIVYVDNHELEALKQISLEIALRINVLQGYSLLEANVTPPRTEKRKFTKKEIALLLFALIATVSISVVALQYDQPLVLLAICIAGFGYEPFIKCKRFVQKKYANKSTI